MNVNWDKKVKYDFLDIINKNKVKNFNDFHKSLSKLTSGEKGIYFEYFCHLYFKLDPITREHYPEFYLYNDIPYKLKKKTNIPTKDKGIDCLTIDKDNNIFAIQVKYRSNIDTVIPFGELATFPALTFGTDVKIDGGIYFSSCRDVCDDLKNDKYTHILFGSFEEKCDELFWQQVKDYIGNKPLTKYKLKTPFTHQNPIIKACKDYYKHNNYGRLYLACGTGKTFTGYWIGVRELNMNKIFIVVPSLYLLSQTYESWYKETQYDKEKYTFVLIGSDLDKNDEITCEYKLTTNKNVIKKL